MMRGVIGSLIVVLLTGGVAVAGSPKPHAHSHAAHKAKHKARAAHHQHNKAHHKAHHDAKR
jgi:hypothetical protein